MTSWLRVGPDEIANGSENENDGLIGSAETVHDGDHGNNDGSDDVLDQYQRS